VKEYSTLANSYENHFLQGFVAARRVFAENREDDIEILTLQIFEKKKT
jgi:hypothetical protein